MTTLAYRAGQIAADSGACVGSVHSASVHKIARSPQGHLVAAAGTTLATAAIKQWVEHGMKGKAPGISDEDMTALLIRPDGTVCLLGGNGIQAPLEGPFFAYGTGREIAMGAMAMGATAEEAVRIACQYDGGSREPVRTMRLGD